MKSRLCSPLEGGRREGRGRGGRHLFTSENSDKGGSNDSIQCPLLPPETVQQSKWRRQVMAEEEKERGEGGEGGGGGGSDDELPTEGQ